VAPARKLLGHVTRAEDKWGHLTEDGITTLCGLGELDPPIELKPKGRMPWCRSCRKAARERWPAGWGIAYKPEPVPQEERDKALQANPDDDVETEAEVG
jgi:hypothetical protein